MNNDKVIRSARERHREATRSLIVDTALRLMRDEPLSEFSHEEIARRAGVGARTVYRYFPNRAVLIRALWEALREETGTRWPQAEAEIVPAIRAQFRQFETHAGLVRASIAAAASAAYPMYGSAEGRSAFRRCLAHLTTALPEVEGDRLIASCVAIYSGPFWQMLQDRGQLDAEEAVEAAAFAIDALLRAAHQRVLSLTDSREETTS